MTYWKFECSDSMAEQPVTISADGQQFQLSFVWPDDVQDIYDNIAARNEQTASTDPINRGGQIVRDYDWIDYYKDITDVNAWLTHQTSLPYSLLEMTPTHRFEVISENVETAQALDAERIELSESLCWQATIDFDGTQTICSVRPGSGYYIEGTDYMISWSSEKPAIGRDDLSFLVGRIYARTGN